MTHVVEPAASGRSKCRGCGRGIAKGELRFGERLPNPFADGDMTVWFHVLCAAYRRPESLSEVLPEAALDNAAELTQIIEEGLEHSRLERISGVEQAPSARARCRHCNEMIDKDAWRIKLSYFEEGVYGGGGNVHVACGEGYFGTSVLLERLEHFADLDDTAAADLRAAAAAT